MPDKKPVGRRDPTEVPVGPTPEELDPLETEAHYRSPEHEQKPEYEVKDRGSPVPPEVKAGGTSGPFEPERAGTVVVPADTSKPGAKEKVRARDK